MDPNVIKFETPYWIDRDVYVLFKNKMRKATIEEVKFTMAGTDSENDYPEYEITATSIKLFVHMSKKVVSGYMDIDSETTSFNDVIFFNKTEALRALESEL